MAQFADLEGERRILKRFLEEKIEINDQAMQTLGSKSNHSSLSS